MNRKFSLKFALLGATALTLVACGEADEEVLAYPTVEACIDAGQQDEAVCRSEYAKAQALNDKVAPRYASADDCYSNYGYDRCYQRRSAGGGSIWLPFMMGYMLAPRGRPGFYSTQPLYRTTTDPNRFYTAGSRPVGAVSATGRAQVARSQVSKPPVRARTVARGGFGRRATFGRGAGG